MRSAQDLDDAFAVLVDRADAYSAARDDVSPGNESSARPLRLRPSRRIGRQHRQRLTVNNAVDAATVVGDRKPGRSIVNQKQTPWALIAASIAVVLSAGAIIVGVVATRKDDTSSASGSYDHTSKGGQSVKESDPYRHSALPAAMAINGVTYRVEAQHNHVDGTIKYDSSPPIGGNHNQYWANCTGTVYSKQIANENAVHMLEHGAIWITYNPNDISGAKLATLKKYVSGVDRLALSPYAGLKTPISLQAWGYQLFLSNPSDPRIAQFIKALKYNQKTTPEYGASCSDPQFKASESTPGHPFEG